MKKTTVFVNERVFTGYFTKKGKPRTETVHYAEEMYLNDTPIENNYDALLAINAAEEQIKRIVCSGVNCECMKPYAKPVTDVFTNLKKIVNGLSLPERKIKDDSGTDHKTANRRNHRKQH